VLSSVRFVDAAPLLDDVGLGSSFLCVIFGCCFLSALAHSCDLWVCDVSVLSVARAVL
jgi:hypothetical protein